MAPQVRVIKEGKVLFCTELYSILGWIEETISKLKDRERILFCFDADGTLWRGDITDEIFYDIFEYRWLNENSIKDTVIGFLKKYKLPILDDLYENIKQVFFGFNKEGLEKRLSERFRIDEDSLIEEFYTWESKLFSGLRVSYVEEKAKRLAKSLAKLKVAPSFRELFSILDRYRIKKVVLSASLHNLVKAGITANRLKPDLIRGVLLRVRDEVFTEEVIPPVTFKKGKIDVIKEYYPGYEVFMAFGDNPERTDRELLSISHYKVIVEY